MFAELFACLDCALVYNGNPWGKLVAIIGEDTYGLCKTPALIGLYGGWYTIKFRCGKLTRMLCTCIDCHSV